MVYTKPFIKWAGGKSSIVDKLYFNIMKTKVPTIIVIDGGGYKASAKDWLVHMIPQCPYLLAVWNMKEFQSRVNSGFLG